MLILFAGCGPGAPPPPQPSPPPPAPTSSAECPQPAAVPIDGSFDDATLTCVQSMSLVEACGGEPMGFWRQDHCPTLSEYIRAARPRPGTVDPYGGSTTTWGGNAFRRFSVRGCEAAGDPVYVVRQRNAGTDGSSPLVAVFDATELLLWLRRSSHPQDDVYSWCCMPEAVATRAIGWGTPVDYDCTDAIVYGPDDFDTGASGDTGP